VTGVLAYSGSEAAQQIVNWLSLGSIYALLAIGIAAVYAVLGLINFAHGEILTLSGIAMLLAGEAGWPWQTFIPVAILTGGIVAVLMERIAFRPVRNAPPLTLLLTSLGLSLIIQNLLQLWRGPRAESIDIPNLTAYTFTVAGVIVQWVDVATILTTLVALVSLNVFLRKSVRGLAIRASAEDFTMTRLMGIRANTVITAAFAASGLLAGLAAFFYLGTTTGQVGYDYGFNPLLKGLVAAVIGGLGSLSGAVLGGFILAGLEIFFQVTLPADKSPYSTAIVFGIAVLVLLFRPQGVLAGSTARVERV
jgi:branched-chain amino acid transport system permease protein